MPGKHQKNKIISAVALNAGISLFSFFVLLKAIDTNESWRIVSASIGFVIFSSFSFLLFKKLSVFKKHMLKKHE